MENFECRDQHQNLCLLLAQTRDAIYRARRKQLRRYNITPRQSVALFVIHSAGDKATPANISRWLFRESHTVSELLSRMERQGLVRRVKDLGKKNLVRIELTEKGRKTYHQSAKQQSISDVMSSLSEEECQQLMSYLQILRDNAMKELGMKHEMSFSSSQ